ncbi:MAG: peptidoglycan-associated lipoprotein Pal [Nitrospirota bacterium]
MKRLLAALLIVLGIIAVTGCAQRKVAQAPEQQAPAGMTAEERQKAGAAPGEPSKETVTEQQLAKAQPAAPQPPAEKELPTKIQDIHFDFDRYDVRDDAKPVLKELAAFLSNNRAARVIIEGHCDDRGTDEYNLALGERRATAAKEYLVSLGIPSNRIETVSYGEEKPLCTEGTEECWAKNRRAHFVLVEGK